MNANFIDSKCITLAVIHMTVLLLLFGAGGNARAVVISHNGSIDSSPPGSGIVDVTLTDSSDGTFPDQFVVTKVFEEVATHELTFSNSEFSVFTARGHLITNPTSLPWTGIHIDLLGANFLGADYSTPALDTNPVVLEPSIPGQINFGHFAGDDATIASSMIVRGPNNSASLWIQFDNPVVHEGFVLVYGISAPTGSFNMRTTPIAIPEPTACALIASALVGIVGCRQKSGSRAR